MIEEKSIVLSIPPDVQVLCELLDVRPEELLTQFLRDLCSMQHNSGSNARLHAKKYMLSTYITTQSLFTNDFSRPLLDAFEDLYIRAYPTIGNKGWELQRAIMLEELREKWLVSKQKEEVIRKQ
jgi:hypothetical protein